MKFENLSLIEKVRFLSKKGNLIAMNRSRTQRRLLYALNHDLFEICYSNRNEIQGVSLIKDYDKVYNYVKNISIKGVL